MSDDQGGTIRRKVEITNRRGLHARAAAKFVKTAEQFDASIMVCRLEPSGLSCAGERVSGRSIMGLMMLAASPGTTLELMVDGQDAAAAVDALAKLVSDKFDED
jgi:phosphocarrier protein HPr